MAVLTELTPREVTMHATRTSVLISEISAMAAALVLSCCLYLPVEAIAETDAFPPPSTSYQGIFATVGMAQKNNKGIGNGFSGGFGLRSEHWGMKLCAINNPEFDSDRISILPALFSQAPLIDLGDNRTSSEYGFDLNYYINVNKAVSLYAGPGLYYIGEQDIQLEKYADGSYSKSAFAGPKTVKFAPSAEGGIHLNIPLSSRGSGRLLLGVGYHTQRGITADLGLRF